MQSERQRLKSEINQCFPEGIVDKDFDCDHYSKSEISAPLVLSSVCRKWRQVAYATPQLWTLVPLCVIGNNYLSLPRLTQEWISRSAQSIYIFVNSNSYLDHVAIDSLITVINQYSTTWPYLRSLGLRPGQTTYRKQGANTYH
ncbi:hypothetical protein BDZ97DRAFT_1373867 [Flammula alnicola]|nr:hypothetical protein BDZ97DRAFT_1373867 [Flammula alnicola]